MGIETCSLLALVPPAAKVQVAIENNCQRIKAWTVPGVHDLLHQKPKADVGHGLQSHASLTISPMLRNQAPDLLELLRASASRALRVQTRPQMHMQEALEGRHHETNANMSHGKCWNLWFACNSN